MNELEQERRGICCHEVGHAVVMHAYDLPVQAVWVKYTKGNGGWHWSGDTLPATDQEGVPLPVRCVIWTAGKMAEQHFDCRAHDHTWRHDYGVMASRLDRSSITPQAREQRIDEAEGQARAILRRDHDAALRVFDWLVVHQSIDGDTFKRLMHGGS
jgi:hypothetical protein